MDTNVIIASVLNFAVVVFVFVFFGRKPFAQFLVNRSESFKLALKEAEKMVLEARADFSTWEVNWSEAQAHARQNKIDSENSLKKFQEKTLTEAKHESERIKKDAELMSSGELLKAKKGIEREVVERSVELAELYLGEHLPAQDKHKLVTEFVDLVGHGAR